MTYLELLKKYTAYQKKGSHHFFGDKLETVVVSNKTGKVVGHFVEWYDGAVTDNHNFTSDGLVRANWDKERPKGWRKCRQQTVELDWAIDALADFGLPS